MSQNNYLGRCAQCDYALFATPELLHNADDFKAVKAGAGAFNVENIGVFARCTSGHRVFGMKRVKGTYSESHKCDARCLNAKGHDCTCSCGGANHGRGHVAAVVEATPTPAVREPGFIGEVGKYIRGTATVTFIKFADDYTLYKFRTDSGASITWFAPTYVSCTYQDGQRVTFRAKVKRHDDSAYGKATLVTHLEEVENA